MKCLNPDCGAPFNYREGRLIRFCKPHLGGQVEDDQYYVKHFWLCGSCSNYYIFEYQRAMGMKAKLRVRELQETAAHCFAVTA